MLNIDEILLIIYHSYALKLVFKLNDSILDFSHCSICNSGISENSLVLCSIVCHSDCWQWRSHPVLVFTISSAAHIFNLT